MVRSWGTLVVRELARMAPITLVACSPAAPAPVEPPPPPPPVVTASAVASVEPPPAAPKGPSPELGAFVRVPTESGSGQPFPVKRLSARSSTFAIEIADLRREWGHPACPVASPGCNLVSIAPYATPLSTKDRLGALQPAGLGAFSDPVPGAAPWIDLSSGKDVVYGLRAGDHLAIDRIDASGKATPFVVDEAGPSWTAARVLETDAGIFVAGTAEGEDGISVLRVARVEPGKGGAAGKLGETVVLPFGFVPPQRPSAQGARQAEDEGRAAVWGPWFATSLHDASGKPDKTWALVLVQVNPPPFNWKAGRPYKKPEPKPGAKNGCGGPGSRSLTDRSVEKVVRVLRFEGTKLVSNHAVDRPAAYDAHEQPISVAPGDEGAVVIDGIAWGPEGKKLGGKLARSKPEPRELPGLSGFQLAEPPGITEIGFDEASGEGLVIYRDGRDMHGQRFDRDGKPVGAALPMKSAWGKVVRVGETWMMWESRQARFLTGPNADKVVEWSDDVGYAEDGVARGNVLELTVRRSDSCSFVRIDAATREQKKEGPLAFCSFGGGAPLARFRAKDGKEAFLVAPPGGKSPAISDSAGALTELPPESKPTGDAAYQPNQVMHVGGDIVLVQHASESSTATWLGAGKSVSFVEPTAKAARAAFKRGRRFYRPSRVVTMSGAPIVADWLLLPDEPGAPFDPGPLHDAAQKGCMYYQPTGPRRAVMACVEPTDPKKPGFALGLRTFRY